MAISKCLVTGPVVTPEGEVIPTGKITFTLSARDREDGSTIMPVPVEGVIDEDGNVSVELWPNEEGVAGTYYLAKVTQGIPAGVLSRGYPEWRVVVPDTPTANLAAISTTVPPASVDDAQAAADAAQAALAAIEVIQTDIGVLVATLDPVLDGLDDILAVSAALPQVVTVAGIDTEVVAVAGIRTELLAVHAQLTAILDVAAQLAKVVTVADNMAAVVAVNNALTAINAVYADLATITSVANNLAAILAVEGLAAQVAADRVQTGLDALATAADRVQTALDVLSTAANATTATTQAGIATTQAASATASMTAAQAAQLAAEAAETGAEDVLQDMQTALANVDDLDAVYAALTPAAREIVAAADVVDVFIYDTTLDSDGGAWRKRCNWTSWMKETLGTATRGNRNQFPQKALIVARPASVTIYDLDQASCPMWMVFNRVTGNLINQSGALISVVALNGVVHVAAAASGLRTLDFVLDRGEARDTSQWYLWNKLISDRNITTGAYQNYQALPLISNSLNDLATTVLPGTPIDRVRKLPTPTVAVATAGGVSVIHWDGRVANSASTQNMRKVAFDGDASLWYSYDNFVMAYSRSSEYAVTGFALSSYYSNTSKPAIRGIVNTLTGAIAAAGRTIFRAGDSTAGTQCLEILKHRPDSVTVGAPVTSSSAVAMLTSKYSTGYMVGDTKLALAESTADLTSLVQGATDFVINTEMMTGGDLPDSTGWSLTNAVIAGGEMTLSASANAAKAVGSVAGKRYQVTYTIKSITAAGGNCRIGLGTTGLGAARTAPGTYTETITAAGTNPNQVYFFSSASSFTSAVVDDISVKEVVTTVLYDDFGGYADTAAMLAAGWVAHNCTVSLVSGKLRITSSGAGFCCAYRNTLGLVAGSRFRVTGTVERVSGTTSAQLRYYTGGPSTVGLGGGTVTTGGPIASDSVSAPLPGATFAVSLSLNNAAGAGEIAEFDNVRIDRVAEDRSVAGNHPLVYGTVTRTAVATGAELAMYGGFSASSYLSAPYASAFDFAADFDVEAFVIASSVGASRAIAERAYYTAGAFSGLRYLLYIQASGIPRFFIDNNGAGSVSAIATTNIADGRPHRIAGVRRGAVFEIWVDDKLEGTAAVGAYSGAMTNANATLRIGNSHDNVMPATSVNIALPRISATAPTPQQIRDMYEAERPLFQPNAKCLLQADSVSALAYDDSTELLHVATTGGMARLKDLLVVSKDAIVVTGIDAKSGIVVTRDGGSADAQLPSLLMREELLGAQKVGGYDRDKVKGSAVTTNATPTIIGRIPFDKGEWKIADVRVRANQYAEGAGHGRYVRRVLVDRPEEGNIALAGSVETMGTDGEGTGTQDIGLTVNTTTQTLDITATGLASTNLEWAWEAILS